MQYYFVLLSSPLSNQNASPSKSLFVPKKNRRMKISLTNSDTNLFPTCANDQILHTIHIRNTVTQKPTARFLSSPFVQQHTHTHTQMAEKESERLRLHSKIGQSRRYYDRALAFAWRGLPRSLQSNRQSRSLILIYIRLQY